MAARADLLLAYAQRRAADDEDSCEQIADSVAELDDQLRSLGVRGRLAPLEPAPKAGQALQPASPRRPQPAPAAHRTPHPGANLRRPLPAVDVCDADAALLRQSRRPRRRHPPRQLRLPARRQRCHPLSGVGGSVLAKHPPLCRVGGCSTSAPSNPKNAGAPHFHAAIRGTIPRAELRAITVATYHQVWCHPTTSWSTPSSDRQSGTPGRGLHRSRHRGTAVGLRAAPDRPGGSTAAVGRVTSPQRHPLGSRARLGLSARKALGLQWPDVDLTTATVRARQALQRRTWQHGCADPYQCGQRYHKTMPCKPGCRRHQRACPAPCPPDCTDHARWCPQRKHGGLVLDDAKSCAGRRTIALPPRLVALLGEHRAAQQRERNLAGDEWEDHGFVFTRPTGRPLDPRADNREWVEY
jgi:hypothetical protein